jgi:hypothetical protein
MRSLALAAVVVVACANTNTSTHFPYDPPPNPSGEPPNEAVGPEAAGAPYGPVTPGAPPGPGETGTPSVPDPGPRVVGNTPAKPPSPPAVTDALPIDPGKPMPGDTLGTNARLELDQPASVMVDGRADIDAASLPTAERARGGVLPTQLVLAMGGGVVRLRGVTGKTSCAGKPAVGPDETGCARLVGVFAGDRPVAPRHGGDELSPRSLLRPALGETFSVGDGLTGTGTGDIQTFAIPKGATKLYLGYAGDTYARNAGGVSAIVTQAAK